MDYDYYIRAINLVLNLSGLTTRELAIIFVSDDLSSKYVRSIINKIRLEMSEIEILNYDALHLTDRNRFMFEFGLIRESDFCITSASSYSWWASWLNTKCKAIISPKYWLNYYKYTEKSIDACSEPFDIEMSLSNQYFIYSKGFFHSTEDKF